MKYLPTPEFAVRAIAQDQLLVGESNTMTVTLNVANTKAAVEQPAIIVLSGLKGMSLDHNSLVTLASVDGGSDANLFCAEERPSNQGKVTVYNYMDGVEPCGSNIYDKVGDYNIWTECGYSMDQSTPGTCQCASEVVRTEYCNPSDGGSGSGSGYRRNSIGSCNSMGVQVLGRVEAFGSVTCSDAAFGIEASPDGDYRSCFCREVDRCTDFPGLVFQMCPGTVMEGGRDYVFTFTVDNPDTPQNPPLIFAEAFSDIGVTQLAPRAVMTKPSHPTLGLSDANSQAKFKDPFFVAYKEILQRRVSQSNPFVTAQNNLTVTLQTNFDVDGSGSPTPVVSITGLTGAVHADGNIDLFPVQNDGHNLFCSGSTAGAGTWTQSTTTLALALCTDKVLRSGEIYSFAFEITNGVYTSSGSNITIELVGNAAVTTSAQQMQEPSSLTTVEGIAGGSKALFLNSPLIQAEMVECMDTKGTDWTSYERPSAFSCDAVVTLPLGATNAKLTVLLEHAQPSSDGYSRAEWFNAAFFGAYNDWERSWCDSYSNTASRKCFDNYGLANPNPNLGKCGQYMTLKDQMDVQGMMSQSSVEADLLCTHSPRCGCQTYEGVDSGTISILGDGSAYGTYMMCDWIIATGGVIDITFDTFELDADGSDFVEVYECTSKKCEDHELVHLETYHTKSAGEGAAESSSTGFMKIRFFSNEESSYSDWNYSSTSSGFSASFTVEGAAASSKVLSMPVHMSTRDMRENQVSNYPWPERYNPFSCRHGNTLTSFYAQLQMVYSSPPYFSVANIGQIEPLVDETNTITVTLRADYTPSALSAGQVIKLKGFRGALSPGDGGNSDAELVIKNPSAATDGIFCNGGGVTGNRASLILSTKPETVELTVCPGRAMEAGVEHVFSFEIQNPPNAQRKVTIMAQAVDMISDTVMMAPSSNTSSTDLMEVAGFRDVLRVVGSGFSTRKMSQTNPYIGEANTLVLELQVLNDIPGLDNGQTSKVVIQGLDRARFPSAVLTLTSPSDGNQANELFCSATGAASSSDWDVSTGKLTLSMCSDKTMSAGTLHVISIPVTNSPYVSSQSPAISISLEGNTAFDPKALVFPGTDLDGNSKGANPLTSFSRAVSKTMCLGNKNLETYADASCSSCVPIPVGTTDISMDFKLTMTDFIDTDYQHIQRIEVMRKRTIGGGYMDPMMGPPAGSGFGDPFGGGSTQTVTELSQLADDYCQWGRDRYMALEDSENDCTRKVPLMENWQVKDGTKIPLKSCQYEWDQITKVSEITFPTCSVPCANHGETCTCDGTVKFENSPWMRSEFVTKENVGGSIVCEIDNFGPRPYWYGWVDENQHKCYCEEPAPVGTTYLRFEVTASWAVGDPYFWDRKFIPDPYTCPVDGDDHSLVGQFEVTYQPIPSFKVAAMRQSDPTTYTLDNVITVTVRFGNLEQSMKAGSKLTFSGMTGANLAEATSNELSVDIDLGEISGGYSGHALFCSEDGTASKAKWDFIENLELVICDGKELDAEISYAFSFTSRNPPTEQSSPEIFAAVPSMVYQVGGEGKKSIESFQVSYPDEPLKGAPNGANPFQITTPGFQTRVLYQRNPTPSAINTLTLEVDASIDLEGTEGWEFTISPLTGANFADANVNFTLAGPGGGPVGGEIPFCNPDGVRGAATWDQTLSQLNFTLCNGTTITALRMLRVSFEVRNPDSTQNSPRIFLQARSRTGNLFREEMSKPGHPALNVIYGSDPLLVTPRFVTADVGQSSIIPLVSNNITVTLSSNIDIRASDRSRITISGFEGASVGCNEILLYKVPGSADPRDLFCLGVNRGYGQWSLPMEGLKLRLCDGVVLNASSTYKFKFTVQNPTFAQESPEIRIKSTGSVGVEMIMTTPFDETFMGVVGGASPMVIRSVIYATTTDRLSNKIADIEAGTSDGIMLWAGTYSGGSNCGLFIKRFMFIHAIDGPGSVTIDCDPALNDDGDKLRNLEIDAPNVVISGIRFINGFAGGAGSCSSFGSCAGASVSTSNSTSDSANSTNSSDSSSGNSTNSSDSSDSSSSTVYADEHHDGGCLLIRGWNVRVVQSSFAGCRANRAGGAIAVDNGAFKSVLEDITISNSSAMFGGALSIFAFETAAQNWASLTDAQVTLDFPSESSFDGILDFTSEHIINGLNVTNCQADDSGGAIFALGGIYSSSISTLNATGVSISSCSAETGSGGGIEFHNISATMSASTVENNHAKQDGGGILSESSLNLGITPILEISGSVISNNFAEIGSGGGLWAHHEGGTSIVRSSHFRGNNAWTNGGGLGFRGALSNTIISDCVVRSNIASKGAGVYGVDAHVGTVWSGLGSLAIHGSDVSGNQADNGGGVYASVGRVNVTNSTINSNLVVGGQGGGIYVPKVSCADKGCITMVQCEVERSTGSLVYVKFKYGNNTEVLFGSSAATNADSSGVMQYPLKGGEYIVAVAYGATSTASKAGLGMDLYTSEGRILPCRANDDIVSTPMSAWWQADKGNEIVAFTKVSSSRCLAASCALTGFVQRPINGETSISTTRVSLNTAWSRGGGISLGSCHAALAGCHITDNYIKERGGGIFFDGGGSAGINFTNSHVSSNIALDMDGGGIYAYNAVVDMVDTAVTDNVADLLDGGGISFAGGSFAPGGFIARGSSVSGNKARRGGGVAFSTFGYHRVTHVANGTGSPLTLSRDRSKVFTRGQLLRDDVNLVAQPVSLGSTGSRTTHTILNLTDNQAAIAVAANETILLALENDVMVAIDISTGSTTANKTVSVPESTVDYLSAKIALASGVNYPIFTRSTASVVSKEMTFMSVFAPGKIVSFNATESTFREHDCGDGYVTALAVDKHMLYTAVYLDGRVKLWSFDFGPQANSSVCQLMDLGGVNTFASAVRSMTVSKDGLYIVMALDSKLGAFEEFPRQQAKADDEQNLKVVSLISGVSKDLLQYDESSDGATVGSRAIAMRNIAEIRVDRVDGSLLVLSNVGPLDPVSGSTKKVSGSHGWILSKVDSLLVDMVDSRINDNNASLSGGGFSLENIDLFSRGISFRGTRAIGNWAGLSGGGFYLERCQKGVVFSACDISNNTAILRGAGLEVQYTSKVELRSNSSVNFNTAELAPAVHFTSIFDADPGFQTVWVNPFYRWPNLGHASLNLHDVLVEGNTATGIDGQGAITIDGDSVGRITGSTFRGNNAHFGAALCTQLQADVECSSSSFVANTAIVGAVFTTDDSRLKLQSVEFTENDVEYGSLALNSTLPLTIGGISAFERNYARTDGASIYAMLQDSDLSCDSRFDTYPFMTVFTEGSKTRFVNNTADGGGACFYAQCVSPSGETMAFFQEFGNASNAQSSSDSFEFSGNTAGYGPVAATQVLDFVHDEMLSQPSYKPGENLASVLYLRDSFQQRAASKTKILPYNVDVEVLSTCTGSSCRADGKTVELSKTYPFQIDGYVRLALSETNPPWPFNASKNAGAAIRTFHDQIWLSHRIPLLVGGLQMPTVVYPVTRDPCDMDSAYYESSRKCEPCLATEYSLNPDQFPCQQCPPDATCFGDERLIGNTENSTWTAKPEKGYYLLENCPRGHKVVNTGDGGYTADPSSVTFDASVQGCDFCGLGEQCLDDTCIICSPCPQGKYKGVVGPSSCEDCPVDTYKDTTGGEAASACTACGAATTTYSLKGRTAKSDCQCAGTAYKDLATNECKTCPTAARCNDEQCLMAKMQLDPPVMTCEGVIGNWSRDGALNFCPTGYEIQGGGNSAMCDACQAGTDCTLEQCTVCIDCHKGYFKSAQGPGACEACGINTYNDKTKGATAGACLACRPDSTTNGTLANTEADDCVCSPRFYYKLPAPGSCVECPAQAMCADKVCMFQKWPRNATEGVNCPGVEGRWARDVNTAVFKLFDCPPGYAPSDAGCVACGTCGTGIEWCRTAEYILSGKLADGYTCQPCPVGAECNGKSLRALNGLDEFGAIWVPIKDKMYLRGCPVGHQLKNVTVEDQECMPCEDDEYIFESNDPSFSCHKCPESAICPYGGPPEFGQVLTTTLSVAGLDLSTRADADALAKSYASTVGIDPASVVVGKECKGSLDAATGVCDATARRLKPFTRSSPSRRGQGHVTVLSADRNVTVVNGAGSYISSPGTLELHLTQTSRRLGGTRRQSASSVQLKVVTSDETKSAIQKKMDDLQSDSTALVSQLQSLTNKTVSTNVLSGAVELLRQFGWIYEINSAGVSILVACPKGHLLVNVSVELQDCIACEAATYSLDPTDGCAKNAAGVVVCNTRQCNACPAGATCAGLDAFSPKVENSCWKNESSVVAGANVTLMRLFSCPPGYVLVRDAANPALDQCTACPLDYYSLERAIHPGVVMISDSITRLTGDGLCIACPTGATCSGFQVNIKKDYWRGPDMLCPVDPSLDACNAFSGCDPRKCYKQASTTVSRNQPGICSSIQKSLTPSALRQLGNPGATGSCPRSKDGKPCRLRSTVHICPIGACKGIAYADYVSNQSDPDPLKLDTAICNEGRKGQVCSICLPGFALSSGECVSCQGTSEAARYVVFTFAGIAAVIIWYYVSWTVYLAPAPDELVFEKESFLIKALHEFGMTNYVIKLKNQTRAIMGKILPVLAWAKEIGVTECVKITISFYQIVASFPRMYAIPWPKMITDLTSSSSSFAYLDIMGTLGISCMTDTMKYFGTQVIYTVFPLTVCLMMFTPSIIVIITGHLRHGGWYKHPKYEQVVSNFFAMLMLWLFIIYPTVSVTVLKSFNCDSPLERLRIDYRVVCSWMEMGPLFYYAAVFVCIYPIGIPAFVYAIMYAHGIPGMAKGKMFAAAVESLIDKFKKSTVSQEGAVIGRLVGSPSDPSYPEKVEDLFNQIDVDGGGTLDAEEMVSHFKLCGITKMTVERLKPFMKQIGLSVDDEVDKEAFEKLVSKVAGNSLAFTGHEKVEDLSHAQLTMLYVFPWIRYEKAQAKWQEMAAAEAASDAQKKKAELEAGGVKRTISGATIPSVEGGGAQDREVDIEKVKAAAPPRVIAPWEEEEVEEVSEKDTLFETFVDPQKYVRAQNLTDEQLRDKILEKAGRLAGEKIITIKVLKWDGSTAEERLALQRIGSVFAPYKVEFWYFELIEMGRKLILTSIMAFFFYGSAAQIAAGIVILFFSTLIFLSLMPYRKGTLNGMQVYALVAQVATLFYGLMIKAEKGSGGEADTSVVPYIIFLIDVAVVAYPIFDLVRKSKEFSQANRKFWTFKWLLFWKSAERKDVRIPVHASVMPALHVDKDSRDSGMVMQQGNGAGEGLIKRTASEEAFSMYAATEGAIEDVEEERMLVRNFITESNRRYEVPYDVQSLMREQPVENFLAPIGTHVPALHPVQPAVAHSEDVLGEMTPRRSHTSPREVSDSHVLMKSMHPTIPTSASKMRLFELREDDDSPPRSDVDGAVGPTRCVSIHTPHSEFTSIHSPHSGAKSAASIGAGAGKSRPNVDMKSIQSELVWGVRVPEQVSQGGSTSMSGWAMNVIDGFTNRSLTPRRTGLTPRRTGSNESGWAMNLIDGFANSLTPRRTGSNDSRQNPLSSPDELGV